MHDRIEPRGALVRTLVDRVGAEAAIEDPRRSLELVPEAHGGLGADVRTYAAVMEELSRGYIGVGLQPVPVPESFQKNLSLKNSGGLMVLSVEPTGPADKSGTSVKIVTKGKNHISCPLFPV